MQKQTEKKILKSLLSQHGNKKNVVLFSATYLFQTISMDLIKLTLIEIICKLYEKLRPSLKTGRFGRVNSSLKR